MQQPQLPPPPVVKTSSKAKGWLIAGGVLLGLGVIGNLAGTDDPAPVAAANDPVVLTDCADGDAFIDARDAGIDASESAAASLKSYDVAGASYDLARASEYTQEMSDIVRSGNASEATHLASSADAMLQASDYVGRGMLTRAMPYINEATREMSTAVDLEYDSQWC